MKRFVLMIAIGLIATNFSGCILSKTPNTNDVTMNLGEQKSFSVNVFPPATYTWTLDDSPLTNTTNSYTYTALAGTHTLTVNAKHILGVDPQTWTVYGNSPPVADAGADQTVKEGTTVTLDASNSTDPDNNIVSYLWEQTEGTTVSLSDASTIKPTFTAPNVGAGGVVLKFKLTVTDNGGLKSTATCNVNVTLSKNTWQRLWGGTGWEDFIDVYPTLDGNYISAGSGEEFNIMKFNIAGEILWEKLVSDSDYLSIYICSIRPTNNGGYITVGVGYQIGRWDDVIVTSLDSEGDIQWQKSYGGSREDQGISIQQTVDGGYIIAGLTESTDIQGTTPHGNNDCYLIKLDKNGEVDWQKMYGGTGSDIATSVIQTEGGGYIVGALSASTDIEGINNNGGYDVYILKLDENGEIEWQRMCGGSGEDSSNLNSPRPTSDGGYIVAGYSNSTDIPEEINNGGYDGYLFKIDSEGNLIWQYQVGGINDDIIYTIRETSDNGFITIGHSNSTDIPSAENHGNNDFYLTKLDNDGNILWQRLYGGSDDDEGRNIIQTDDEGFIVVGGSNSTDIPGLTNNGSFDAYILKLDQDGNL